MVIAFDSQTNFSYKQGWLFGKLFVDGKRVRMKVQEQLLNLIRRIKFFGLRYAHLIAVVLIFSLREYFKHIDPQQQHFAVMAAIAFDATANSGSKTLVSSFSYNHTVTGTSTVLVVGVAMDDSTAGDRVVDALTYATVGMTFVDTATNGSNTQEMWYLLKATAGVGSVAVTLHGTNSGCAGGSISLSGVGSYDATNKGTGTSSTPSVSVTTIADNSWIVDAMNYNGGTGLNTLTTTGSGQTSKVVIDAGASAQLDMSYVGPITPAAAYSMAWSATGTARAYATVAASFAPPYFNNKRYLINQSVNRASTY